MRHAALRYMPLVLCSAWLAGCDNDPASSNGLIPLYGDVQAYHIFDERSTPPTTTDTVVARFTGSGVVEQLKVVVNGSVLPRVPSDLGLAVHAANIPVAPGHRLTVSVSTPWQESVSAITPPAAAPRLTGPPSDSVHERSAPIRAQWADVDTGTVVVELWRGTVTALFDTLWTSTVAADSGSVVIPASVWSGRSDTTAVLAVWYVSSAWGDGFEGTVRLFAGFGVRRMVRVTADSGGTTARSARSRGTTVVSLNAGHAR